MKVLTSKAVNLLEKLTTGMVPAARVPPGTRVLGATVVVGAAAQTTGQASANPCSPTARSKGTGMGCWSGAWWALSEA